LPAKREYVTLHTQKAAGAAQKVSDSVKLIVHFVIHIIVASFLFGVVTLAAFALWWFTQWIKELGAPDEITFVSYAVSELLFWIDVLCFGVFVVAEAYKLVREIITDARKP
jgi:hypothetical protein